MKRHALFVGVNNYADSTIQNLNYSSEDATELASVFRHLLYFDRVEKLINPGHSPEIVDAVNDMTRGLGTGDLFLFFFAGHGFRVKENHVLVCAKDEFLDLEDEYAGLQVGRLKKRMRGPWNRMLVLDACQNDIRATRGADCGIASRDLELIHACDEDVADSGVQIVITSCSEGEKALESSDLKHGLFTSAFLHAVTSVDGKSSGINLESLRMNVGARMNNLIKRYHLSGKQTPMFTMPPNAGDIILLDGEISEPDVQRKPLSHVFVVCPMCGKKNPPADTFRCRECGSDNLCLRHQDEKTFLCFNCADAKRESVKSAPSPQSMSVKDAYERGENYYYGRNGFGQDYAEAVKWYRKAADQGNAFAQYKLGVMYSEGRGVPKDEREEVSWYRKAAEQGHAQAQYNLGWMYANGEGVAQNDYEAVKWFRKAAEQGFAAAQYNLGLMYENDRGVAKDDSEAVKWYRKSAEQGDASAQCNLGFMYVNGRGVAKDEYEAVKWYRKSAEQGDAAAQHNLGLMYYNGRGVAKDESEAVKWYRKAAEQGLEKAKKALDRL